MYIWQYPNQMVKYVENLLLDYQGGLCAECGKKLNKYSIQCKNKEGNITIENATVRDFELVHEGCALQNNISRPN